MKVLSNGRVGEDILREKLGAYLGDTVKSDVHLVYLPSLRLLGVDPSNTRKRIDLPAAKLPEGTLLSLDGSSFLCRVRDGKCKSLKRPCSEDTFGDPLLITIAADEIQLHYDCFIIKSVRECFLNGISSSTLDVSWLYTVPALVPGDLSTISLKCADEHGDEGESDENVDYEDEEMEEECDDEDEPAPDTEAGDGMMIAETEEDEEGASEATGINLPSKGQKPTFVVPTPKKQASTEKPQEVLTAVDLNLNREAMIKDGKHLVEKVFTSAIPTTTEIIKVMDCTPMWCIKVLNAAAVEEKKALIRSSLLDPATILLRGCRKGRSKIEIHDGQHSLLALQELFQQATSAERVNYEKVTVLLPVDSAPSTERYFAVQSCVARPDAKTSMREMVALMEVLLANARLSKENCEKLADKDLTAVFKEALMPEEYKMWWLARVALLDGEVKRLLMELIKKLDRFHEQKFSRRKRIPTYSHFYINLVRAERKNPSAVLSHLKQLVNTPLTSSSMNTATKFLLKMEYDVRTKLREYGYSDDLILEFVTLNRGVECTLSVKEVKPKRAESITSYAARVAAHALAQENLILPSNVRSVDMYHKSEVIIVSPQGLANIKRRLSGNLDVFSIMFGPDAKSIELLKRKKVTFCHMYLRRTAKPPVLKESFSVEVEPIIIMCRKQKKWLSEKQLVLAMRKAKVSTSNVLVPEDLKKFIKSLKLKSMLVSSSSCYLETISVLCRSVTNVYVSERISPSFHGLLEEKLNG